MFIFAMWLILTFVGPVWNLVTHKVDLKKSYSTANRDSAGIASKPYDASEAIIHVYSARAFNWRGLFGSHSWIALKPKNASLYTVYQVVGWRAYRGLPALAIDQDIPDRNWYGEVPTLVLDIRAEKAEMLIPAIDALARSYPYAKNYRLWPGPNSNTFPAYIARRIPQLQLALPASALGKDFLGNRKFFARAPSATGYQFSFFGAFGILFALKEGIEINIFGVVYGVRFFPFRILLPGWGY